METLSFSGLRLNPCAAAIATAFALQPLGAAGQQIVPDGQTATSISVQGHVTDVTTASVIGPNAFNSFQRFDVWSGNTVNLHVPQAASNLINLVHGETTRIDGILNAVQGGNIGGNVFFLNPHGIIVGREGVINAGALTLITPTKGFTDSFFDTNGLPNGAATAQVLAGQVPINANGLVWVQGRINASTDVRIQAGNVINAGAILSGAVYEHAKVDFSDVVNVAGLQNADTIRVENGVIEILASNDITHTGTVASEGANNVAGGKVVMRAGNRLDVSDDAVISARGRGSNSRGGEILTWATQEALLRGNAKLDARGGEISGDGGFIDFSGRTRVAIDGGSFLVTATHGVAGSILIDPEYLDIGTTPADKTQTLNVFTQGGNLKILATGSITIGSNVVLSTRAVAGPDTGANHLGAASTGNSGSLTLEAPTITLQNGSMLLAHAVNAGGTSFLAGDVALTATSSASFTPIDLLPYRDNNAAARIELLGATIRGGKIDITASADTSKATTLNDTPFTETLSDMGVLKLSGLAGFSFVDTKAEIKVGSGTSINGTGDVTISATSKAENKITAGGIIATITYARTESDAKAVVESGASVTAGGTLSVLANAESTVEAKAVGLGQSLPGANIAISETTTTSEARIASGAIVNGGNLKVGALNTNTIETAAEPLELVGDSKGAAISLSWLTSTATATLAASTTIPGSISVLAETKTDNQTSAAAEPKSAISGLIDPIKNALNSKDKSQESEASSIDVSAAVVYADATNTVNASIAPGAIVRANDAVRVHATIEDDFRVRAGAEAEDAKATIAGAVSVGDFRNRANAWIDGDVSAGNLVDVHAKTEIPNPFDLDSFVPDSVWEGIKNYATDFEGIVQELFTSYVRSASSAAEEGGKLAIAGSVNILTVNNSPHAWIGGTARINKDAAYRNAGQVLNVKAENILETINIVGVLSLDILSTTPISGGTGGGKAGLGGSYSGIKSISDTAAWIADGADAEAAGNITVESESTQKLFNMTISGGSAEKFGVSGAFSMTTLESDTVSFIDEGATVKAGGALTVKSTGKVRDLNVAGGVVKGANIGVGFTVSLNTVDADTKAFIGNSPTTTDAANGTAGGASGILISAKSENEIGAYSLAAALKGKEEPKAAGEDTGQQSKSGIQFAGDASVNRIQGDTLAYADGGVRLEPGTLLTVTADNTATLRAVSGAVAISTSQQSNGIAGSFGMNDFANNTRAYLDGVTVVRPTGGTVTTIIDAKSNGSILAITAGGAGAGRIGVAGSVSLNTIDDETSAYVNNSEIEGASLGVSATNERSITAVAGALSFGGKAGFGASVGINTIDNRTYARITNSDLELTGALGLNATSNNDIFAVTAAIGASSGNMAAAAAFSMNDIGADTQAYLSGKKTVAGSTADGAITISAADTSLIQSITGGVGIATGNAGFGASFAWNTTDNQVLAYVSGAPLDGDATVDISAISNATIQAIAVGGAGAAKVGVAATGTLNEIDNTTSARVDEGAVVTSDGAIKIAASDTSAIDSLAGAVAGGGKVSAGAAAAVNTISNTISAYVRGASVESTANRVDLTAASTGTVRSASAAGAGAGNAALAGAASVNTIDNTVEAYAARSIDNTRAGTLKASTGVGLAATDTSTIKSLAGAVSGAGTASAGASVAKNDIGDGTKGVAAYLDGTGSGATATAGGVALTATSSSTIESIAAAGAGAGTFALGGSVTLNDIDTVTEARIGNGAQATATGAINLTATDGSTIQSIAGSVAASGSGAFGAAVATNEIGNVTRATVAGANATSSAGLVDLSALSTASIQSLAAGIAASGSTAIAGGASVNFIRNTTEAVVNGGAQVSGRDGVSLTGDDTSTIESLAGQVSVAGDVGVGASAAYNDIANTIRAASTGSTLTSSLGSVRLASESASTISTIAAGGSGGGVAGIAGSAAINLIDNTVESFISGGSATADDTVAVTADSNNNTDIYGGTISGGGAVGLGGSAAVNVLTGTTQAYIADGAAVTGLGKGSVTVPNATGTGTTTLRGVGVIARSSDDVDVISANASGGGAVGLAATVSVTTTESETLAYIDGATINANNTGADALQTVQVKALNSTSVDVKAGGLAFGGAAGVGATLDTTILTNTTKAYILDSSDVKARDAIAVESLSRERVSSIVISGAAAGTVSVAGSVGVLIIDNENEAFIEASTLRSEGDLRVVADDEVRLGIMDDGTRVGALAGNVSVGGVAGVGGSVVVTSVSNETTARMSNVDAAARGTTTVRADSMTDLITYAASGNLGGYLGAGGAVTVNTVKNSTQALIDERNGGTTSINQDATFSTTTQDVAVSATDAVTTEAKLGAVSVGALAGVGASIDVTTVRNTTAAAIGDGVTVSAGRDISVSATATKSADSIVAAVGGGIVGVQGAVSVINLGATISGDAASESKNTSSAVTSQISGSKLKDVLGNSSQASRAKSASDAKTNTLSVSGEFSTTATVDNATKASIGANATVTAISGDIVVSATDTAEIDIIAGAAAGGVVGIGGAVGFANVRNNAIAEVGAGSVLKAGDDITISATGNVNSSDIEAYAGAAGAVGLGAAVAYLDAQNNATARVLSDSTAPTRIEQADAVVIKAETNTDLASEAWGGAVGAVAVGGSYARAKSNGTTTAELGADAQVGKAATTTVGSLTILADSDDQTEAKARAGAAGLFFSGSGALADAISDPTVTARTGSGVAIDVNEAMTTSATGAASANASAVGVSVSAGAGIGASISSASAAPTVTANIGADNVVDARNIAVSASQVRLGGRNSATSNAQASAGGALFGAVATRSDTRSDGDVRAWVGDGSSLSVMDRKTFGQSAINDGANTITFAAKHRFKTGDVVFFDSQGGALITGLTDQQEYYVIVVDANTIKLASTRNLALAGQAIDIARNLNSVTVPGVNLTDASGTGSSLSNVNVVVDGSAETLSFSNNHNLTNGQRITYRGVGIDGLTTGATYFVQVVDAKTIRLASSLTSPDPVAVSIAALPGAGVVAGITLANPVTNDVLLRGSTSVDSTGALVFATPHAFKDGDAIEYSSTGSGVSGLTQNATYYVKVVDANSIKLQTDNSTALDISLPSGTTVNNVSFLDVGAVAKSVVNGIVTVDNAADTLTFSSAHPFQTGDRVVYTGTGITGLTAGTTYYVERISATAIQLQSDASTYVNYGGTPASTTATFTTTVGAPLLSQIGVIAGGTGNSAQLLGFNVDHGFADGQQIRYTQPSGAAGIPGLVGGTDYFVRVVDGRTVQLTTSIVRTDVTIAPTGAAVVGGISLVDAFRPAVIGATATVNGTGDTIAFANDHGFAFGQQIQFKGSGITGLADTANYYALVVDSKTLRLASSLSRTDVALTPTPAGTQPVVLTLTDNSGTGPSISNAIDPAAAGYSTVSLGANNSLVFGSNHGLTTGTEVTFNGSGIQNLNNDTAYFVVVRDANTIQLAATRDDAIRTANTPSIVPISLAGTDPGAPDYTLHDPSAGTRVGAASDSKQSASVSGISVSLLLAIGSNESTATATTRTEAHLGKGVTVTGGSLRVEAVGLDNDYAQAESGSGGLISGAAASADVVSRTTTRSWIEGNDAGNRKLVDVQSLAITADHTATVNSRANSINAAAVGVSGAWATNRVNSQVEAAIGDNALVDTKDLTVNANNRTRKPLLSDYNVESGSGGFFNGAAAKSETNIANDTAATLGLNVDITVSGTRDAPGRFDLNALNDVEARDRAKLDAGGAIAIASAQSIIRYENVENPNSPQANQARVVVGDGSTLTSVGDINLGARTLIRGTDGNGERTAGIDTNANAKTYGLAGAAQGHSIARAHTADTIIVGSGATLESQNDINLNAGRSTGGAENDIYVSARTDLWNKTVFPIETSPEADGEIIQHNTVDVRTGATVRSVKDVNLVADGGLTKAVGYGIGKDLYREALAAVGSAISNAFGGGDVNLDIHGGSTTVTAQNRVIVNGTVDSGIYHEQYLTIDALGNIVLRSEGISASLVGNQSLQREIQKRIVLLQQLAAQYASDTDVAGAFLAEKAFLEGKLARLGGENISVSFIDVADILARSGNVNVTADSFVGNGVIRAPGDVKIIVDNASDRFLRMGKLTIPEEAGGFVTFNGVAVANNDDINVRQAPGSAVNLQTLETTFAPERPLISVKNTFTAPAGDSRPDPEIYLNGEINNIRGTVAVASTGSIVVGARIEAQTVDIRTDGDFIQQFIWGFSHQGGAPRAHYNTFARSYENLYGTNRITSDPFNTTPTATADAALPTTREVDPDLPNPAIIAGNNVFIAAEKLNINGTIQSGLPMRTLTLAAALNSTIASYTGTSKLALNTLSPGTGEIAAFWNPDTQRIEVNPVKVQGGYLEIYGNIFSTGSGKLRTIDGYGRISIDNQTNYEMALNRLDVGPGIAGTIKITDTAPDKRIDADTPLTTLYTRVGDTIVQTDNRTVDGAGNPTNVVATVNAPGAIDGNGQRVRSTTYQPDEFRRYVWVTGRRSTLVEKEIYQSKSTIGIDGLGKDPGQQPTRRDVEVVDPIALMKGEFLEDVGPAAAASMQQYEFEYNRFQNRNARVQIGEPAQTSWGTDCLGDLCFSRIYQSTETYHTAVTQTYRHSIKADVPIGIEFFGFDAGAINVNSVKSVHIGDNIINRDGATSITSTQGSIQQLSPTAIAYTSALNLKADLGVGTSDRAIRSGFQADSGVDVTGTLAGATTLKLETRAGGVYLTQIEGQARVDKFTSQLGDARLLSDGGITALNANALVKGNHVELVANAGAIGSLVDPLGIQVGSTTDGDGLKATAAGDIGLRQATGDLWVEKVLSRAGDVRIEVPNGGIRDVNPVETRDERTVAQLQNLWSDMRLIGDQKTLADSTIKSHEALKEREYQTYWRTVRNLQESTDASGNKSYTASAFDPNQGFALSANERDYYRVNLGWSEAQIAQLERDRAHEYGSSAFNPNFQYVYDVANDPAKLTNGAAWTEAELRYSISAGALKEVTDTNVRLEDPNIAGRNVTVATGNGGIGSPGAGREVEIIIPAAGQPLNLSEAQILALAAAERRDITIVGNRIVIANPEDFNIDATGVVSLSAQAAAPTTPAEIFLGSRGDLRIANVATEDAVRIKAKGFIGHVDASGNPLTGAFIRGGDMILEAARGAIGADGNPVRLQLRNAAKLTARAQDGIWLEADSGDMNLDTVYSPGSVHLKATAGSITDGIGDEGINLRARDGSLTAGGSIGAAGTPLDVRMDDGGSLDAVAAGDIHLRNPFGTLYLSDLSSGGITTVIADGLHVRSDRIEIDDVRPFGASTLVLDLAGRNGSLAQAVDINAFASDAIRVDLLRAQTAAFHGDIANLRFMETLIGQDATFANRFYRVVLDNTPSGMIPGYDMQIYSIPPFYLYFQADRKFETNAIVVYFADGFEVNGGGSETSLATFGPKLLTLTHPSLVPPGEVAYSPGGNGRLDEPEGLVETPADPLGPNPDAIGSAADTQVNAQ